MTISRASCVDWKGIHGKIAARQRATDKEQNAFSNRRTSWTVAGLILGPRRLKARIAGRKTKKNTEKERDEAANISQCREIGDPEEQQRTGQGR